MMKKKILIFTMSVWNENSGADTFANLFKDFDDCEIANIYFKSGFPTSKVCGKYFNISESKALKSIFKRKLDIGEEIDLSKQENFVQDEEEKKRYSFWSKHRLWGVLQLREIAWKLASWKSKNLIKFVDDFKPDIIVAPLEQYSYYNRIVKYISRRCNCKNAYFMYDDNISYKQYPFNIFYYVHRFILRRQLKSIFKKDDKLFCITRKTKTEADRFFNTDSVILTKASKNVELINDWNFKEFPLHIVYTGNLNIGRFESLNLLLKAVNEFNKSSGGQKFVVDVYSHTNLDDKNKNKLSLNPDCNFYGSIPQNEVYEVQKNGDILLLLESLRMCQKNVSRLSFSTKIVDYLSVGRCILSIAPLDNATSQYFDEYKHGVVCSNKKDIKNALTKLMNHNLISELAFKAKNIALDVHSESKIHSILKKELFN